MHDGSTIFCCTIFCCIEVFLKAPMWGPTPHQRSHSKAVPPFREMVCSLDAVPKLQIRTQKQQRGTQNRLFICLSDEVYKRPPPS
mmetsp:Transcript_18113/g.28804  ORF Transcript_18113/g.28804 Transcript_18113/m.28804 type:complete len:85 (-) Transcript_18113:231-485(-)